MFDLNLSIEEEVQIDNILSEHHTIFQTFWMIGQPIFSEKVPTAAVGFDKEGHVVYMIINPNFWASLNIETKAFVIAHECLHVILNHGKRSMGHKDLRSVNIAQDIVINEMLVKGFGFNKYAIEDWQNLCFVNTVFDPEIVKRKKIIKNGSFNYYLDLMDKYNVSDEVQLLDQHQFSNSDSDSEDIGKMMNSTSVNGDEITELFKNHVEDLLSEDELEQLKDILENELNDMIENPKAGTSAFGSLLNFSKKKKRSKKKWETIVKSHLKSIMSYGETEKESWIVRDRKYYCLDEEYMMQGDWQQKGRFKDRYNVVFFLDTSGSCLSYAQRFVDLLKTIPKSKFKVDAFSFDTSIYPIDIEKNNLQGGGGTSFKVLDEKINEITKKDKKHPDLIFVLTDGYASQIEPKKPNLWYWLLTPMNTRYSIPDKSVIYNLKDFN